VLDVSHRESGRVAGVAVQFLPAAPAFGAKPAHLRRHPVRARPQGPASPARARRLLWRTGMSKGRVLVVDDEANARTALGELLRAEGYVVEMASDGFEALGKLADFAPDVVLTDLKMPGMNGLDLLTRMRERGRPPARGGEDGQRQGHGEGEGEAAQICVIVMTAFGAIEGAVTAMREGAADYLTKPLNLTELTLVLERELERLRLRRETGHLRARLAERYSFENIIGSAPAMQEVFKTVAQVATSRASVLITGESGTGKELIAAAIHQRSQRARGPFVKLHCAALAETLIESELFGHERGAFTGAVSRREGRFAQAHGGTLFLDEIGEVSASVQVKLLRFLQEHELERVGSNLTVRVDVRVIAATNRDLGAAVADGRFREDLFYRLNVITLTMPPLRERASDVLPLASHFLRKYAAENGKALDGFSEEALARLSGYGWPGNVRELENAIERAVVLASGPRVTVAELPAHLLARREAELAIPGSRLDQIERYAILKTLESTGGSTSKAAEMLGTSVRKIQYKLHEYHAGPKGGTSAVAPRAPSGRP
jgi:DNA-binding NtrC family response regulator